jgi:ubiquinone/menaquinone biosynthesis C-methylase UbiE
MEMEPSACVCGMVADETRVVRRDLMLDSRLEFRVGRCPECGVERLNPRPTEASMPAFYPFDASAYQPYANMPERRFSPRRWDRRYGLRKRLRAIERHVEGGKLLDVGAASGDFLSEVARSSRWTAEGVEPQPEAGAQARARGLTVYRGTLESCNLPSASYDVITLWDVFEHLHDPQAALAEAARLLRPGGLLVMSTPNLDSWDRRLFGKYWIGYELPRHLYLFNRRNAIPLLARQGFDLLEVRSFFGSHAYFMTSLRFLLMDAIRNTRARQALVSLAFSIPVRLLMIPYFWLADRLLRTTTMTLFAQKQEGR